MPVMKPLLILLCLLPWIANAGVAEHGTFEHDGVLREHYIFVPPDAGPATPLIVALHGMGGNAAKLRYGIGLTERAEQNGFAVVYPQGLRLPQGSRHWNAGFDLMPADDLGYLTALTDALIKRHNLSRNRVMVFGISMGGYMAYHMACRSDLPISAAVSVAGNISGLDWAHCKAKDISLLHIHGKLDPLVRYAGSRHWSGDWIGSPPVEDLIATWARNTEAMPREPLLDNAHVQEQYFENPASGVEVQLLTLPAFGHDWPSQETAQFDAIDAVMDFIARHDGRHRSGNGT